MPKSKNTKLPKRKERASSTQSDDVVSPDEIITREDRAALLAFKRSVRIYPLPPPEELKQYNDIVRGMAERLLKDFEQEREHRHRMDNEGLRKVAPNTVLWQWQGFATMMACIVAIVIVAFLGQPYATYGIAAIAVAAVGSQFWSIARKSKSAKKDEAD
ncbi:MAG: DUF2335 domain-containing protein [Pseudomonadota bacterium]